MEHTILIGGEAGQGLQTVGEVLSRALARAGLNVFTSQDYESRIRGGHNTYKVRFSVGPLTAQADGADVIVALDRASAGHEAKGLNPGGTVLYDSESLGKKFGGAEYLDVPFKKLAVLEGGSPVMSNTVALGALLGIIGIGTSGAEGLLKETFGRKGEEVVSKNVSALLAGYEFVKNNCPGCEFGDVSAGGGGKGRMLINATEAITLGALASGVRFYSAYPMTPSTGIMTGLAARAEGFGVVVEQAEDEISAINMALGASFGGLRAMTGTSGGGFALMAEGLSLAGMTETPIVIALGQRPGPATGFPTRTEQGDLLFILHAGHGEFPRIVFAPGSPEEAFLLTNRAFELSEKYQVPAFVVFDQYLADCQWTLDGLDTDAIVYNDYRLRGENFRKIKEYKRHEYTETGVTPLGVPGDAPHLVVTDSDEHDEEGHIVEDAHTRTRMIEKRLIKKTTLIKKEMRGPLMYGPLEPEVVLVGWGSTFGIIKEAVDLVQNKARTSMLHFSELCPFPENLDFMKTLEKAGKSVCIEQNATGQFARLLKAETGFGVGASIKRYDGRPLTVQGIIKELDAVI